MIDLAAIRCVLVLSMIASCGTISSLTFAQTPATPVTSANDPNLRSFHSANGLLNRGMFELAAQEYRAFLAANAGHEKAPIARYGLGVSLYRLKQFDPAIVEFEQLRSVKDFTYTAEVLLLLGQSYLETQKRNEATAAFEALLSAQPQHQAADDAAALIVETLYRDKQYDKVRAACERLQQNYADSPLRDRAEYFHGLARQRHRSRLPVAAVQAQTARSRAAPAAAWPRPARWPRRAAAVGVGAQPVGIAHRVPGPAGHGAHRQQRTQRVAGQVGTRVGAQVLEFHLVDTADAGGHQHQRRQQPRPGQATVAPGIAQVAADGDHHRQRADDHGRQRSAGMADGAGQEKVVDMLPTRPSLPASSQSARAKP